MNFNHKGCILYENCIWKEIQEFRLRWIKIHYLNFYDNVYNKKCYLKWPRASSQTIHKRSIYSPIIQEKSIKAIISTISREIDLHYLYEEGLKSLSHQKPQSLLKTSFSSGFQIEIPYFLFFQWRRLW